MSIPSSGLWASRLLPSNDIRRDNKVTHQTWTSYFILLATVCYKPSPICATKKPRKYRLVNFLTRVLTGKTWESSWDWQISAHVQCTMELIFHRLRWEAQKHYLSAILSPLIKVTQEELKNKLSLTYHFSVLSLVKWLACIIFAMLKIIIWNIVLWRSYGKTCIPPVIPY